MGDERDGANHRSAKSTRDRDRLRQENLERPGWRLHRARSTNWFDDPAAEAAKIRAAIERRLADVQQDNETRLPHRRVRRRRR
ncbi:MAG TPA: hypothetical protein H9881_19085 [Candidatus Stackebrandtia excrementipullorum]|nr:hypothetical protein [Candidatus Stackebrandtia excrementipullorum]